MKISGTQKENLHTKHLQTYIIAIPTQVLRQDTSSILTPNSYTNILDSTALTI